MSPLAPLLRLGRGLSWAAFVPWSLSLPFVVLLMLLLSLTTVWTLQIVIWFGEVSIDAIRWSTGIVRPDLHPYLRFITKGLTIIFMGVGMLVALVITAVDVLVAYSGAAKVHGFWLPVRSRLRQRFLARRPAPVPVTPASPGTPATATNPLAPFRTIGIILSGGGAKGAYQAGALKAIHEFLEQHGAHEKVTMVAGTSIGSWNALFWLADLVKGKDGKTGALEEWWSTVDVWDLVTPSGYVPFYSNYVLSNEPWRKAFDRIFGRDDAPTAAGERLRHHLRVPRAADALHFYFTYTNIRKARLEFTTNRRNLTGSGQPGFSHGKGHVADDLAGIRHGVFASMDIPPLFQYATVGEDSFEDGGVIDNLPTRFGTDIEGCDLLFVLPLNASFNRALDRRWMTRRLLRVMEVRQGVLERNSFKMLHLYNELGSLRNRIAELERAPQAASDPVRVFAVCPAGELMIDTMEFWKADAAREAFRFMYRGTKETLQRFTERVDRPTISMALLSPATETAAATPPHVVTDFEDF